MSRPKGSPRTPGSGRKAGTPNRKTIERRLLFGEGRRANGTLLAREVLEQSMLQYLELASQCAPPEKGQWQAKKQKLFHFYRERADLRARWLAPFQSPTYRSITMQPPPQRPAKGGAIDALEDFMLRLARARRLNPPKTIEAVPVPDETPAEAVKVVDGKNGNGSA
jgi:hypothetical protein